MEELKKAVTILAQEELKRANQKFPMFHSWHESHSVIMEEMKETKQSLILAEITMNTFWRQIKNNDFANISLDDFRDNVLNVACEAIQVMAMIQKTLDSNLDKE